MSRRHNLTDEQLARMFAWRRANKSFAFIAMRMGCSIGAVRHQCLLAAVFPIGKGPGAVRLPMTYRRNGVTIRRFTPEEDAIILAMDADDIGSTEIGRALGRPSSTISNRLLALVARQLQEEAA